MRILIVSQYFRPDNFRINDIAAALAEEGHTVRVLTGLPDYATSRVPEEFSWFRRRKERWNGVDIVRVPIIARRDGKFFRALNYASFAVTGWLYAKFCKKQYDVVISYETSPIMQSIPAVAYKNRAKVPLLLYCCDIWPECLKAWNVAENSALFRSMYALSRWIYNEADLVPVTSRPFAAYLREVNAVPAEKIVYLPQHAEDIYADICGQYEDNGCVDFLFAGNIGAVQDVECIVRAAAFLPAETGWCIHIVGDGSQRAACEQLAAELGVGEHVLFHGKFPLAQMRRFYLLADCFLLTLRGDTAIGMTLPAKAQGYISAGKPIVAAINGAAADMIREADCGLCVPAGDAEQLAQAMREVLAQPALYRKKGQNGRQFYERNYTKTRFMQSLNGLLRQLADKP